jgi:hypothetical protein
LRRLTKRYGRVEGSSETCECRDAR